MLTLFFNVIFSIYFIFYILYIFITRRTYPGFIMRFGIFSLAIKDAVKRRPNIWVHAVSVGEVIVIDAIITSLIQRYPKYQIIATVTTKTGLALAQQRLAHKAIVLPAPFDFSYTVNRFRRLIQPKIYVVAETEIWPNTYLQMAQAKIPVILVNGRLSDRAFGRYQWIKWLLKSVLNCVTVFAMQSQQDAHRIKVLGANPAKVIVSGNIKFDDHPLENPYSKNDYGFNQEDFIFIAGSTHPGEEEIMLKAFKKLLTVDARWRLVLAPRHIERTNQVVSLVEQYGYKAIRLSQGALNVHDAKAIVVVDTIGHLRSLYALADIVFVGKSLCVGGGHNIIEPAFYAKPVMVGPMMANFRDIMRCFNEGEGVLVLKDAADLEQQLLTLAQDESLRKQWGARSSAVVQSHKGALDRLMQHIDRILGSVYER